jgi:hypothetical protein
MNQLPDTLFRTRLAYSDGAPVDRDLRDLCLLDLGVVLENAVMSGDHNARAVIRCVVNEEMPVRLPSGRSGAIAYIQEMLGDCADEIDAEETYRLLCSYGHVIYVEGSDYLAVTREDFEPIEEEALAAADEIKATR